MSIPLKVTYINHASVLIEINGTNIITDPIYSYTVGFIIPRLKKPGIPFNNLPPIDVILVSHNHHDHLNLRTLRRLRRKHESSIVVPRGLETYARRAGYNHIVGLGWWKSFERKNVKITSVPAKHSGRRTLFDKNTSAFCGYVIEANGTAVYFAGDTGYGEHFKDIAEKFSLDLALLPIGAYKPYEWFKNIHLNPKTALQAFLDLRAKHLVPIHWGTFKISDEPLNEPPVWLKKEARELGLIEKIHILRNGQSFLL